MTKNVKTKILDLLAKKWGNQYTNEFDVSHGAYGWILIHGSMEDGLKLGKTFRNAHAAICEIKTTGYHVEFRRTVMFPNHTEKEDRIQIYVPVPEWALPKDGNSYELFSIAFSVLTEKLAALDSVGVKVSTGLPYVGEWGKLD